jgi:hypothetical protein
MGSHRLSLPHFLFFVFTVALVPATAAAQAWSQPWADPEDRPPRVDLSASAGFLMPTRWSSLVLLGSVSSATGVLEQVLARDLRVAPDREFTAAATYWRGRYGFRTQAGFSRSSLEIGSTPSPGQRSRGQNAAIDVNTWLYDLRGAIGFLDYNPTRSVWPYGFFGFGGITYDLKRTVGPPLTFIERVPSGSRDETVVVVDNGRTLLVTADELGIETVFAANFGVGSDFRIPLGPAGIGLRVEVSDHVAPSPLGLRVREISAVTPVSADGRVRFGFVHHLSATAGLVVHVGRRR